MDEKHIFEGSKCSLCIQRRPFTIEVQ